MALPTELTEACGITPLDLMGEILDPTIDRHVWAPSRVPDLSDWVCPYLTDPHDDREVDEDGVPTLEAEVRKHGVCTRYSSTLTEIPLDRIHYIGQARPQRVIDVAAAMEGRRKMIDNTIGTVMSRGECWESHNRPEDGAMSETLEVDDDGYLTEARDESVMLADASEHFDARTAALLNAWRDAGNPDEMPRPQPGRGGNDVAPTHAGARTHGAGEGITGGRGVGHGAGHGGGWGGQWLRGWNKPAMAAEVVLLVLLLCWLL